MVRFIRWSLVLILLAAITATAVIGLRAKEAVDVASITRGSVAETLVLEGTARATDRYVLSAPVNGWLKQVNVQVGDLITKEQFAAEIGPLAADPLDDRSRKVGEAKREAARVELKRATKARERAADRLSSYQKRKPATTPAPGQPARPTENDTEEKALKVDLELAELAEEKARLELEAAEASLFIGRSKPKQNEIESEVKSNESTTSSIVNVRVPSDGTILRVLRRDAGPVSAGSPLLEVGNLERLEFEFAVRTKDLADFSVNAPVRIKSSSDSDLWYAAHVTQISRAARVETSPLGREESRALIRVTLDQNVIADTEWGDGFDVEAELQKKERRNVLKLPLAATFRRNDRWYVYRFVNGVAKETLVDIGVRNSSEGEVLSGLSERDLVILYPSSDLVDGMKVKVQ